MNIKPFQGWRYEQADVSDVIAPPYDVLTLADKQQLLRESGQNIVAVDLPHVPPSEVGPDSEYRQSAETLRQWMGGPLRRDERPSLYVYEQTFTWAGKSYCRRTLIAAAGLAEFGKGVWPHEKTFAGPKADRLKLMQETRVQLSPIFGFYEPSAEIEALLQRCTQRPADQFATLRGVGEKLWVLNRPEELKLIQNALAKRDIFIADGHHRYTTALNYRATLGDVPAEHPANFVMFVLASMSDPGLIILPTHRLISGLSVWNFERFVDSLRADMDVTPLEVSAGSAADADALLEPYGPHSMAFLSGEQAVVARLKNLSAMDVLAANEVPAWRRLDVAILHRLVLERHLAGFALAGAKTEYTPDGVKAMTAATDGQAQLVVLLAGTPISAVREIALAHSVMPHKSTYFYPKPATGLVIYPLE